MRSGGYELGAVDYITKPFSIYSLQRKVENVLRMMGASCVHAGCL